MISNITSIPLPRMICHGNLDYSTSGSIPLNISLPNHDINRNPRTGTPITIVVEAVAPPNPILIMPFQ